MRPDHHRRTLLLFGALSLYITLQFLWWAWLLVSKDRELEQLITAFGLRPEQSGIPVVHAMRTFWMVVGEGAVFLSLLLVALWLVYRSVRHELVLARQQRDFLLSVSHELRTPISGMKLHLQTLDRSTLDPVQRSALHQRALTDLDRLGSLTERILLATRLEEAEIPVDLATHDLRTLTDRIAGHARDTYAIGHPIQVNGRSVIARVDASAYTSVLENLLENAARYSPAGSAIDVVLVQEGGLAVVRVEDRGAGIAPGDRSRVFGKFQRGDDETTRRARGTGLGLFIVERLMQRMNGTIALSPRPGGGSIFAATFPVR